MKYALREKDIIVEKATREDSDKKCKAAQKEKEDAVTKMKNSIADKTKFQHLSDSRVSYFRRLRFYIAFIHHVLMFSPVYTPSKCIS